MGLILIPEGLGMDRAGSWIGEWDSGLFLAQACTSLGPCLGTLIASVKWSCLPPRVTRIGYSERCEGVPKTVQHVAIESKFLMINI